MRSIVLSGFMATGKSTTGRIVASRLGLPFVDTDALLAADAGAPVGEVFAREGEPRFRDREAAVVLPLLSDGVTRVMAFGGGTVTIPRVRHAALEAATVVTLTAGAETIVGRATSLAERPNLGARSPVERARDLLALRRDAYAESHATIATEGLSPEQVASRVEEIAKRDLLAVPLGSRSYAVEMTEGEPSRLAEAIAALDPSGLVVVTDTNVRGARIAWLDAAISRLGIPSHVVALPPGEANKNLTSVSRIWDEALERDFDRRSVVLAFGGGVVGDLAGFAASTLLRGVRCVQIPTSLLAMVDSSVGGKTGFDHPRGKNLLGAFFQPSHVVVDLEHLTTLPPRERAAGLAEVVKIAFACDRQLLTMLEAGAPLREIVRAAVLAKIRVVRDDERESGRRALLNLGHTVGHALEASGGYARWLHGEAVAIGTVLEIEAAERLSFTPHGTAKRVEALLSGMGLPTRATREEILAAWPFTQSDKKRAGSTVALPVVTGDGEAHLERVELDRLRDAVAG